MHDKLKVVPGGNPDRAEPLGGAASMGRSAMDHGGTNERDIEHRDSCEVVGAVEVGGESPAARKPHLRPVRSSAVPASQLVDRSSAPPGPVSETRPGQNQSTEEGRLNDARLVAALLGGDLSAFEQLYRQHARFAFNLAVRLLGSSADAEDLVHDAFLRAHQRLASLREPAKFKAWLGSIVVSHVRAALRRRRFWRGVGMGSKDPVELDTLASDAASPHVRAEIAQLYALLRLVPADERIAWTLRHVQRHRLEEISNLTQCSLATAKRRIARAQRFLDDHYVATAKEGQV